MKEEPIRIQRQRSKGWRMPENTVYVGRPSKWGNPWSPNNHSVVTIKAGRVTDSRPGTIEECIESYREDIKTGSIGLSIPTIRAELAGKNLACWCPLNQACHADILLELANQ